MNEEDPERDRATQVGEEEEEDKKVGGRTCDGFQLSCKWKYYI